MRPSRPGAARHPPIHDGFRSPRARRRVHPGCRSPRSRFRRCARVLRRCPARVNCSTRSPDSSDRAEETSATEPPTTRFPHSPPQRGSIERIRHPFGGGLIRPVLRTEGSVPALELGRQWSCSRRFAMGTRLPRAWRRLAADQEQSRRKPEADASEVRRRVAKADGVDPVTFRRLAGTPLRQRRDAPGNSPDRRQKRFRYVFPTGAALRDPRSCSASGRWRFRPRGATSGSALIPGGIFRRRGGTPGDEAVSLSPAVARGPRRGEVRTSDHVRARRSRRCAGGLRLT